MCRLLGVAANKDVDLVFSLKRFEKLGDQNPHGWGIGWYGQSGPEVFKSALGATHPESGFKEHSQSVRSRLIVSHVRMATRGEASERNSHPFIFGGWIFAHNGTVDRDMLLSWLEPPFDAGMDSATDSEPYFRWLVQCIERIGDPVEGIRTAVSRILEEGADRGGMNFLLADGYRLYGFRFSRHSERYYSLYMLKREPKPGDPIFRSVSSETGALLESKVLNREVAALLCSEPLTEDEPWELLELGELVVVDRSLEPKRVKLV